MLRQLAVTIAIFASIAFIADSGVAAPKGVNLGDTKRWQELDRALQDKTKTVNQACGTNLDASYDEKSYEAIAADDALPGAACGQAYDVLKVLCGNDAGKAAIKAKVQHFVCRHSKDGTRVTVEGGTMFINLDPKKTAIVGKKAGSYSWKSAMEEVL